MRRWAPLAMLAAGCASAPVAIEPVDASPVLVDEPVPREAATARELDSALARSKSSAESFAAALRLANLHLVASDDPFLEEDGPSGRRPSPTRHLVGATQNARLALELARRLEAGSPEYADAARELELLHAVARARLGFVTDLDRLGRAQPELARAETAQQVLTAVERFPDLRPRAAAELSRLERTRDELAAYRLAILALEGRERLGAALAPADAAELEAWILGGANQRFVCPRSGTEYVPGQKRSPVSGVPHMEYVAVPRR